MEIKYENKAHPKFLCKEKEDNEIQIPLVSTSLMDDIVSNHSPLRLTGGGEHSFHSTNSEYQRNHLENSMSERDIRDVLFEAGYTIEVIDDIIAAKA